MMSFEHEGQEGHTFRVPVVVLPLPGHPFEKHVLDMASYGRAGLSHLIGDDRSRNALFRETMRADRFFVAMAGNQVAGYLSIKYKGQGPFAPRIRDFLRVYGFWKGLWICYMFTVIEARTRSRGIYLYGVDVLEPFRRVGVGRELYQALFSFATELGISLVELEAINPASIALAKNMGAMKAVVKPLTLEHMLVLTSGAYQRLSIRIPLQPDPTKRRDAEGTQ
jgi:GNAT superfamily N-acetyltransferase